MSETGLIPKHGGYRKLRTYQCAELAYNETVVFCNRFIDKRSRTHEQMVQAARSGMANIAEGSMASGTSKKIELKLTGIARASLEELLLDYEKYLLQNRLRQWSKDSPEALKVRAKLKSLQEQPSVVSDLSDLSDSSDRSDPLRLMHTNAQVAANIMICLVNQTSYLLGRQLNRLEADFATEGGFTERLYKFRKDIQKKNVNLS